jgi:hypothetical protein
MAKPPLPRDRLEPQVSAKLAGREGAGSSRGHRTDTGSGSDRSSRRGRRAFRPRNHSRGRRLACASGRPIPQEYGSARCGCMSKLRRSIYSTGAGDVRGMVHGSRTVRLSWGRAGGWRTVDWRTTCSCLHRGRRDRLLARPSAFKCAAGSADACAHVRHVDGGRGDAASQFRNPAREFHHLLPHH